MTSRPSRFEKMRKARSAYITIGMDAPGDVLVVVYTWRGDRPRLISARKAEPREREQYGSKS